jgi:rhodanese-related sulfurtransferase
MNHRAFKDPLYASFARIGQAVSSPRRIELLELLSQGEKTVEALAMESHTPIKSTSAHLRVLRQARLVDTRRQGTYILYRLATHDVFAFLRSLQTLGAQRLAEVNQVTELYLTSRDELQPVTLEELRRLVRDAEVTVIDVRPHDEFVAGHIPGARSIPVRELKGRLAEIPKGREVIAYCRGPYCVYALDAVTVLRARGFRARRAEAGLADWRASGQRVATGAGAETAS